MKKIFILIAFILAFIVSGFLYLYLVSKIPTPTINQGLYGKVTLLSGNCMPGAGGFCITSPTFSRTIYIREPTTKNLIKQIKTNSFGNYQVELLPGKYSVFVEDNGGEYCNSFDMESQACPVMVGTGTVQYNIEINHAAW